MVSDWLATTNPYTGEDGHDIKIGMLSNGNHLKTHYSDFYNNSLRAKFLSEET